METLVVMGQPVGRKSRAIEEAVVVLGQLGVSCVERDFGKAIHDTVLVAGVIKIHQKQQRHPEFRSEN